jgi:hypothetical protein
MNPVLLNQARRDFGDGLVAEKRDQVKREFFF